MTRRSIVVAVVALAVIAGLVLLLVPAERHLVGLSTTGPDSALLITRTYDPTRHWVEHVNAAGDAAWSVELTPYAVPDVFGTAVAATDELVVVFARNDAAAVVHALDRATGARRWQVDLPGKTGDFSGRAAFLHIDPPLVHVMRNLEDSEPKQNHIDTLKLADGAVAWTYDTPRHSTMHPAGAGRLFIHTHEKFATLLDGATGKPLTNLTIGSEPCRVPTALVTSQDLHAVVVHDRGGAALHLEDRGWFTGDSVCGARGDDLVLAFYNSSTRTHELVRHDANTGAQRWLLDLGGEVPMGVRSVDGRLPRLLPFQLGAGDTSSLVVVDLDTGKEVRRGSLGSAEILVSAEWSVIRQLFTDVFLLIDPATGDLARATEIDNANIPEPDDYRHGVLWLRGFASTRTADYPWSTLDLNTGALGHPHSGLPGVDRTAEYRAKLGW